ncbi:MAG: helix-turn-helix domain-containing protein [Micromonosporaceae bacterium]|jgi:AraC-like DNA-binding protein|nr:helix-turn-helix domain-containing protein [Micromonosporaceae bacterium]
MYGERASRLPGAVVWHQEPVAAGHVQRILPDGCMDLMWYGDRLVVAGPDSTAYVAPAPPGTAYAGVRFPPGTGPAVFGVPAWELRDQRVPLDDLWPAGEVRRLAERVHQATDPGAALEEIAAARRPVPDRLISEVAARLRAGEPVRATAAAVGLSDRQLYRRSLAAFGYGPKTLARIMRMVRALELARAGTAFAAVAAAAGYADQAHLAREVKDLAGVPLSALIR